MAIPDKKPGKKPEAKKPSVPAGVGIFLLLAMIALLVIPFRVFSASDAPAAQEPAVSGDMDQKKIMCAEFKDVGLLGWGCGKVYVRSAKDRGSLLSRQFSFLNIFFNFGVTKKESGARLLPSHERKENRPEGGR